MREKGEAWTARKRGLNQLRYESHIIPSIMWSLLSKHGEPPYAGPHVRWCGETGANRPLLPDCILSSP